MRVVPDTLNFNYNSNFMTLVKPDPGNLLAWSKAFVKGSITQLKPLAPVQVYFGSADTTVPPAMHLAYQEQICKLGGMSVEHNCLEPRIT